MLYLATCFPSGVNQFSPFCTYRAPVCEWHRSGCEQCHREPVRGGPGTCGMYARDTLPGLPQPRCWAVASATQRCGWLIPQKSLCSLELFLTGLSQYLPHISDGHVWNAITDDSTSLCVCRSLPSPAPRESTYLNSAAPAQQQPIYENGEVPSDPDQSRESEPGKRPWGHVCRSYLALLRSGHLSTQMHHPSSRPRRRCVCEAASVADRRDWVAMPPFSLFQ